MSRESVPDTPTPPETPESPVASRKRLQLALGGAVVVLLVFAVYWPVLRGEFVWDDLVLVDKNPLVTGDAKPWSIWFTTDFTLSLFALWLQWLAWGGHAAGYHVVNVLLHAMSALLLWRVLTQLRIKAAWFAAVIFAVHPVCVASVAWISEVKNTLSLPFYLASLSLYLSFEEQFAQGRNAKARLCYWLSIAAFLLALLSKTSTVMLPLVLLGCAWWRRGRLARRDLLRTGPYFALALACGLMTVWYQTHQAILGETVQTEDFLGRLAGAGKAMWFYLGKALLPVNLCMIYPRWKIDAGAPASYLPLLVLCGGFALCWRFRASWGRHALFGLGCFAASLFPVLGFFDMYFLLFSRVSDHFQYLPMIGVVALVAAGLNSLVGAKVLRVAGPALVLALSILTLQRAGVFATDEGLWRDTLKTNPAAWAAHNNLGCILAEQQKYDAAIAEFETSLQQHPRNAAAHRNMGKALAMQGKFLEAEPHFLAALTNKPADTETLRSYASALADNGNKEAAMKQLRAAVRAKPEIETRLQLAPLLAATGKPSEAVTEYRQVLSRKPDLIEALNNLAWILATCSDGGVRNGDEAVRLAERACRLTDYKQAATVGTLAAAYAEAGRFTDAVTTAEKAVELASATGNAQFAGINQQLLALYRAGKPYHEPPAKPDPPHAD